jgi:hypothetical protein
MKLNKLYIKHAVLAAVILILLILAAGGLLFSMQRTRIDMAQTISFPSIQDLPDTSWTTLTQKKIYFAHMSVGYNILDGVQRKQKEVPSFSFPVTELKDAAELNTPGCYHGTLGYNGDPLAKIHSFRDSLLAMKASPPDLALMKFCYVDIYPQTEVDALFTEYQRMIEDLQKEFPNTRFLHCTAPLTSDPLWPKEKVKEMIRSLLGKTTEAQSNQQRHRYNTRIRETFPKDRIFDIAAIESVTPQGHPCLARGGIPMLYLSYTTDGGHLNQDGQDRLGEQFLIILAKNAN